MIKEFPAKVVMIRVYCDDCKEELVHAEPYITLATYPQRYGYVCPKCKKTYCLDRAYPTCDIVQVED